MHAYATNCPHQTRLITFIVSASIIISGAIGWIASKVESSWGFQVGSVSAMAVFGVLYFTFDRWLWKFRWLRQLLLVPDLNGDWTCEGKTLWKEGQEAAIDWKATIRIKQSWSKLVVIVNTTQSSSRSLAASIHHYPGEGFRLIYHYDNTPKVDQAQLARHCGVADLMISEGLESASGHYFTDRDRHTAGTMTLRKGVRS